MPTLTCLRCGHTFESIKEHPKYCPREGGCGQPHWDKEPMNKIWSAEERAMAMAGQVPLGRSKGGAAGIRHREKKKREKKKIDLV